MDIIIGFVMIYAWIHGIIIVCRKVENTTAYEKGVLMVSLVGFVLIVLAIMNL